MGAFASTIQIQKPRLSLAQKIQKIRDTPLQPLQLQQSADQPERRGSALLSPGFFNCASPASPTLMSPTMAMTTRRGSCSGSLLREPIGPDGTRGFNTRCRSHGLTMV